MRLLLANQIAYIFRSNDNVIYFLKGEYVTRIIFHSIFQIEFQVSIGHEIRICKTIIFLTRSTFLSNIFKKVLFPTPFGPTMATKTKRIETSVKFSTQKKSS